MNKTIVDRGLTIVAAVSSPVLTLLVDERVLSSMAAVDVGAIVAAVVAAYHGGAAVTAAAGRRAGSSTP